MTASRGPVPKRSSQRRRVNKESKVEKAAKGSEATAPAPDEKWHPAAAQWYLSLAESGQSRFYEPSDWSAAWLVAESISRDLKPQAIGVSEVTGKPVMATIPMKGASLAAYLKAWTALLVTEGDRRRARLELERTNVEPAAADVPSLDDYRKRLSG